MKHPIRLKWTLGLLILASLPALAADAQRPSLRGTWKLDEDLTARIRARERDKPPATGWGGMSGGAGGGRGGGVDGGVGGPPGGGPGWGGGPTVSEGPPGGEVFPVGPPPDGSRVGRDEKDGPGPSLTALNTLTIAQTEVEITITDQEGHVRTLKTDGSKVRDEKAPGGPEEVRTSWEKDGTLTVKVRPNKGQKRTETYIVSNDGKHLYLTLTMEGDGRPAVKVRRAYAPAPAAQR